MSSESFCLRKKATRLPSSTASKSRKEKKTGLFSPKLRSMIMMIWLGRSLNQIMRKKKRSKVLQRRKQRKKRRSESGQIAQVGK